jgi:PAS domain S-box-containing protein
MQIHKPPLVLAPAVGLGYTAGRVISDSDIREAIYQGAAETRLIGLALIRDEKLAWANRALGGMLGYEPLEQLIGREVWGLFHPDDRDRARRRLAPLLAGEIELVQFETRCRGRQGEEMFCLAGARMVALSSGPTPMLALTNVTERFAFLRQLRESEQRYRAIVEQSADGIMVSDERGIIVEWNPAQEELTGWARVDTLGHYLWEVQHRSLPRERRTPEAAQAIEGFVREMLRTGQTPWSRRTHRVLIERPDGSRLVMGSRVFPIPGDKGLMWSAISRRADGEEPDPPSG